MFSRLIRVGTNKYRSGADIFVPYGNKIDYYVIEADLNTKYVKTLKPGTIMHGFINKAINRLKNFNYVSPC